MERFTGLVGLAVIVACGWIFSTNRKAIQTRVLFWGLGLQVTLAFLVLKTDVGKLFDTARTVVAALLEYTRAGSTFVFGGLGTTGPPSPFGVVFAFQVLPIVIFIASLFSIFYYIGVMQYVVRAMAVVMQRVMGVSGAEATNVAASIFMGQTEAPLTIRPFLRNMTESELFTVMVSGMAHVSGATMAAYVFLAGVDIKHLLTAVIMTAPATIMLAKMFVPETGEPETAGSVKVQVDKPGVNVIDAAARGAGDGVQLAINIGGMVIAFLSLIALVNGTMGWLHGLPLLGWFPTTMQQVLGWAGAPFAWMLGVKWNDCATVGNLIGTRFVLNEFIAFSQLGLLKAQMDPKSFTIATYALCGFANLSSIAIQIGGIGALVPERKSDLARMGLKAVVVGTFANFMSACIAGMLL